MPAHRPASLLVRPLHRHRRPPREQVGQIVSTTAKYLGRCAYCPDPIRPGQQIGRVSATMDWIHTSHALDA